MRSIGATSTTCAVWWRAKLPRVTTAAFFIASRRPVFPSLKLLSPSALDWPKKINRLQIQDLFRLRFIDEKANAIFLGGCGLGKTHLSTALGYAACQHGCSVLF